jgi:hypothetical protein
LTTPLPTSRHTSTPALHLAPERAGIDADQQHADHIAAEDADGAEHGGQQWHGDHAAPEARRQDAADRVDRHHLHGAELLAGLHQADLGGERGAGPAGEEQGG